MSEDILSAIADLLRREQEVREVRHRLRKAAYRLSEWFKSRLAELARELGVEGGVELSVTIDVDGRLRHKGSEVDVRSFRLALDRHGSTEIVFFRRAPRRHGGGGSVLPALATWAGGESTSSIKLPLTSMSADDLTLLIENREEIVRMLRKAVEAKSDELESARSVLARVLDSFSEVLSA